MLGMRAAFSGHEVHLVTMNRTDRDVLMRWKLNTPDHTHVIGGTGLDLARYPVLPFPKGGPVTIAITTRMIEDKGLAGLVEAFRKVRARFPDTELLLVGKQDGRNPTAIPEEQLRAWDREPGIRWLGHVDRVADQVWARAHIAVLPSRREGLPVSLLEAAACGRPMVATDVPGCREVVMDGETGLLVPLGDVQALADALEKLVASEELRQCLGAGARDLVERHYSLDVISDRVADLYRSLVWDRVWDGRPGQGWRVKGTGMGFAITRLLLLQQLVLMIPKGIKETVRAMLFPPRPPLDAPAEWLDAPPVRRNRGQPLVSVVIPCYNYGRFLNDAIASVRAQTLQDFEIIVVDDGSNDDVTPGVLDALEGSDQSPDLTVIRQENQGAPTARNTGIRVAKGLYVCCLDADDTMEPTYLEKCVLLMEGNAGVSLAYSWLRVTGAEERVWKSEIAQSGSAALLQPCQHFRSLPP